ncbi:MAG: hypothetical protein IT577_23685 [Verrucomicrobiae bacterium]|nr:hypothetical protein [Verrucomicrobiae bacterium]
MPFEVIIPARVAETAITDTVDVAEFFEIPVYWDITNGNLYSSLTNRAPITSWTVKRGDLLPVGLRIMKPDVDGVTRRLKFPADCRVYYAAVLLNDYGGTVLAEVELVIDEENADDPVYRGTISWRGEALNAAINFNEGTEKPYIILMGDFEVSEVNEEDEEVGSVSSDTITIRCNNDVRRADAQAPSIGSGLRYGLQFRGEIDGLTGTDNPLDALLTTSMPTGRCMVRIVLGGKPQDWLLIDDPDPGVTVPDNLDVVAPQDYDAGTNAKLWLRIA